MPATMLQKNKELKTWRLLHYLVLTLKNLPEQTRIDHNLHYTNHLDDINSPTKMFKVLMYLLTMFTIVKNIPKMTKMTRKSKYIKKKVSVC